ncbi:MULTISPECIES: TVP38/TMEM64 family protein [Prochlorococcus]|uniref:TVP38/TMEM64 family protein n=1 Tax=Prochlorococcus TaxID=1218 RepID=UPI000533A435|nr:MULTISPECIES: VTT domain-containing protein [Prochlorococcus]KGG13712.1 putative DedA family protein [Prochlorococcus sp. MIT 0601]
MNLEFTNIFDTQLQFFLTPLGFLTFLIIYIIWTIFLLPGSWLSMVAGFIYGIVLGSSLVFIGASIGAILTFLGGRSFLRDWTNKRLSSFPKLHSIEKQVIKNGLKFILLTRLSPLFPFGLLNLAYSITDVSIKNYFIGLIGIFPGTLLYCSLGSFAGEISGFRSVINSQNELVSFIFTSSGLLASIGVFFFIARATRNALSDLDH